jgi:hypothetical protein
LSILSRNTSVLFSCTRRFNETTRSSLQDPKMKLSIYFETEDFLCLKMPQEEQIQEFQVLQGERLA